MPRKVNEQIPFLALCQKAPAITDHRQGPNFTPNTTSRATNTKGGQKPPASRRH